MLITALQTRLMPLFVVLVKQYITLTSRATLESPHSFYFLSCQGLVATSALITRLVIFLYYFMLMLTPTATAAHTMPSSMPPQHQGEEQPQEYPYPVALQESHYSVPPNLTFHQLLY